MYTSSFISSPNVIQHIGIRGLNTFLQQRTLSTCTIFILITVIINKATITKKKNCWGLLTWLNTIKHIERSPNWARVKTNGYAGPNTVNITNARKSDVHDAISAIIVSKHVRFGQANSLHTILRGFKKPFHCL